MPCALRGDAPATTAGFDVRFRGVKRTSPVTQRNGAINSCDLVFDHRYGLGFVASESPRNKAVRLGFIHLAASHPERARRRMIMSMWKVLGTSAIALLFAASMQPDRK